MSWLRRPRRLLVPAAVIVALGAVLAIAWGNPIPSWWNFRIAPWIESAKEWIILHRGGSYWLFRW
jgi:hypothetical protein